MPIQTLIFKPHIKKKSSYIWGELCGDASLLCEFHKISFFCQKGQVYSAQWLPLRFLKVLSYEATCHSNMSPRQNHIHITRGDLSLRHFVAATCRMNSNWFEFMRQVAASNCIKTYMSKTCHMRRLIRGRVAATGRLVWQCDNLLTTRLRHFWGHDCRKVLKHVLKSYDFFRVISVW